MTQVKESGIIEIDDFLSMISQKIKDSDLKELKKNIDHKQNYSMIDQRYQLLHNLKDEIKKEQNSPKIIKLNVMDSVSKKMPHLFFEHITETLASFWQAIQDEDYELAQKQREEIIISISEYNDRQNPKTYQNFISIEIIGNYEEEKRQEQIFRKVDQILKNEQTPTKGKKIFHTLQNRQKLFKDFSSYFASYLEDLNNLEEGKCDDVIAFHKEEIQNYSQSRKIAVDKQAAIWQMSSNC